MVLGSLGLGVGVRDVGFGSRVTRIGVRGFCVVLGPRFRVGRYSVGSVDTCPNSRKLCP